MVDQGGADEQNTKSSGVENKLDPDHGGTEGHGVAEDHSRVLLGRSRETQGWLY